MIGVLVYGSTIKMKNWELDEDYREHDREVYKDEEGKHWNCTLRKIDENCYYVMQLQKMIDEVGYVYYMVLING